MQIHADEDYRSKPQRTWLNFLLNFTNASFASKNLRLNLRNSIKRFDKSTAGQNFTPLNHRVSLKQMLRLLL